MSYRVSAALAALVLLAAPIGAAAQNFSESYNFLEAVRKADGAKVAQILGKPGATIINTRDRDSGETALMIVVAREDNDYTLYMLQHGANPNLGDRTGKTPLMVAVEKGFTAGATSLLNHGANINQPNNSGETPLIRAVQLHDVNMVRLLLDKGADPDRADVIAGQSARDYARSFTRYPAVAKLLEDAPKKKSGAVSGPRLR